MSIIISITVIAAVLIIAALLWHHIPNKRVLAAFCLIIAAAVAVCVWSQEPKSKASPEEIEAARAHISMQQEIFTPWYNEYQGYINQLDQNWQQYHNILESFNEGASSLQTTYLRLMELEVKSSQLSGQIRQHTPPLDLDDNIYDHYASLISKTSDYASAQHQAILETRDAADPAHQKSALHYEQSRELMDIMVRKSPAALFSAEDISAIRDELRLPGK